MKESDNSKSGYTVTYDIDGTGYTEGTAVAVKDASNDSVTIVNHKDMTEDTGLFVNNLPYILILLALGCAIVVYAVAKSRKNRA